jgi:hypothetical protein
LPRQGWQPASDGATEDIFGSSVSLDGDQFVIGALGKNSNRGKAYSRSVASTTSLDTGNTCKTISGTLLGLSLGALLIRSRPKLESGKICTGAMEKTVWRDQSALFHILNRRQRFADFMAK